jgi:hypothetical protein
VGAALALAIMLVVVVGVLSLAVNAQGPFQGTGGPGSQRPARTSHPGSSASSPTKAPRRPPRDRNERRASQAGPPPQPVSEPQPTAEQDQSFGDLRPLNTQAQALVMSVVDERTLGPVTRSRLTLKVQPSEGEPFEVTTRVAFPTPEERARVKVGGTIPVRYDSYDHRRVVVDTDQTDQEAGG